MVLSEVCVASVPEASTSWSWATRSPEPSPPRSPSRLKGLCRGGRRSHRRRPGG
jgi:hypothetical protein